ncbi:Origin recognition complex subunit 2 [Kappamyces sp. JEL0680]|nr:Origin recognition complex subunit 2 [Kappamyces sp. JEL0680]
MRPSEKKTPTRRTTLASIAPLRSSSRLSLTANSPGGLHKKKSLSASNTPRTKPLPRPAGNAGMENDENAPAVQEEDGRVLRSRSSAPSKENTPKSSRIGSAKKILGKANITPAKNTLAFSILSPQLKNLAGDILMVKKNPPGQSRKTLETEDHDLVVDDWESLQGSVAASSNAGDELMDSPSGRELFSLARKRNRLKDFIDTNEEESETDQDRAASMAMEMAPETDQESAPLLETPRTVASLALRAKEDTPVGLRSSKRTRLNKELSKLVHVVQHSTDEEESSSSDEEPDSAGYDKENIPLVAPVNQIQQVQTEIEADDDEDKPLNERFFSSQSRKQNATSNNTLQFMEMSRQEYLEALEHVPSDHDGHIESLLRLYRKHFNQYVFELSQGFNLIFFGFGSKLNMLTEFVDTKLANGKRVATHAGPTITVNGFYPNLNFKTIMGKVLAQLVGTEKAHGSLPSQVSQLLEFLDSAACRFPYITLLIHNIEGTNLTPEPIQKAISVLASHPKIFLVASSDHLNTPTLWDATKISLFNFVWHEMTTYQPYLVETSFENSLISAVGGETQGSVGARFVLASLAPSVRNLFRLLAKHQIEYQAAQGSQGETECGEECGIERETLLQKCRNAFFITEASAFNTALNEFRDHKMVVVKKGSEGEVVYIPMSCDVLEDLVQEIDQSA